MNRRDTLIALLALGAAAGTFATEAQQPVRIRRLGLLTALSPSDIALWHQVFRLGLRDLGWVEGKNISVEYRYAEGRSERLPELAADLVNLKVDVIVASALTDAVAAQKATKTIPIVMAAAGDSVASGLVESLPRPGGNVTGLSQMTTELVGKRLELLKEMIPKLSRVAVLWNPQGPGSTPNWKELQQSARKLGVLLHSLEVRTADDFDKVFADAARARAGALFVMSNHLFVANMRRIVDFAAKSRLPSVSHVSEFADAGGRIAYGPDRADLYRRAAAFVDKILKGAKPADLPVERPTKFELVINQETAKSLGIKIPQSILVRADRVIE